MEWTLLIEGISGAEGPCVDLENNIFMVCPGEGRVLQIMPDGSRRDIADTGGVPAGLQLDQDNHLWVADMKRGILRVSQNGAISEEVTTFDQAPIRGCNDCYFDSKGHLYFTAPAGSNAENRVGEVYCRTNDGAVSKLDGGYAFSNGLAVTQDDKTLIVAETYTRSLWAYTIESPGEVSNKRLWAKLPGELPGGPDGMDFDTRGRLLVANFGQSTLDVFAPDGALGVLESRVPLPFDKPTNVHFCGPDSRDLLVTETTRNGLWRGHAWDENAQLQWGWMGA